MQMKALAIKAKRYARRWIFEGSTQIVDNTYPAQKVRALSDAVEDLRKSAVEHSVFNLELDEVAHKFLQTVAYCKKFSIGNCYEYALMALDYVVHHAPGTNAEVYGIKGGDHAFLVIGRNPDSLINRPETWGKEAYICDPWSNKVYLASEYLTKTKNYSYLFDKIEKKYVNCTEPFHPDLHTFKPVPRMNSTLYKSLNTTDHIETIKQRYLTINSLMLNASITLMKRLEAIESRLQKTYGVQDEKYKIISQKIELLNAYIASMNPMESVSNPSNEAYESIKERLEKKLRQQARFYKDVIAFSGDEKHQLLTYHNKTSRVAKFFGFFKIPPKTVREINKAIKHSTEMFPGV